jgi:hypothetical protein
MASYGTDKPDLRFGVKIEDVTEIVHAAEFKVFKEAKAVLGLCLPKMNASRKEIDELTEFAKSEGALGMAYFKAEGGKLEAPIAKFFKPEQLEAVRAKFGASDGDLIVFAADERAKAQKVLQKEGLGRLGRVPLQLDHGIPALQMERRGEALGERAPSVHVPKSRRVGKIPSVERIGQDPLERLRPGAERQ